MTIRKNITKHLQTRTSYLVIHSFVIIFVLTITAAQAQNTWDSFARTKFEPKYNEKLKEYFFLPTFSSDLKALEGKEVTLQGYYVPFASEGGNYIILSKYPMSQCFFCGGGGPESIAEVTFSKSQSKFKVDDIVTVKGKLKLNTDDIEHVNFILTQADLVSR